MRDFRRLTIPARAHPLVRRLFEGMNYNRICLTDVAERAGVNVKTIKAWRTQRNPNITGLEACFGVLGLELTTKARSEN